jgi:hypothetical protein
MYNHVIIYVQYNEDKELQTPVVRSPLLDLSDDAYAPRLDPLVGCVLRAE